MAAADRLTPVIALALLGGVGASVFLLRAPPAPAPAVASVAIDPSSVPPLTRGSPVSADRDALLRAEAEHFQALKAQVDPARALAMADEGHQRFARGNLFPDREVIAIRSLLRLDRREQAQGRARRFVARFAQHPQAETVRKISGI